MPPHNIIEIGKRLLQAKEMVPKGQWEMYLRDKVQFTIRTAQRFVRVATELNEATPVSLLEPSKVYLLLEAPPEERDELATKAQDMTKRELEEAVREANRAKREAEEAKRRASEAEERATALANQPPKVVEVEVVKPDPKAQEQIGALRTALADKERTIEQKQKDVERVNRLLSDTNRELDKLRQQSDRNATLETELRRKEQEVKQLVELQRKLGANFDDEGCHHTTSSRLGRGYCKPKRWWDTEIG